MLIRCGCDIVSVEHFASRYKSAGERLLQRIMDGKEREMAGDKVESMAALFAAKEAFAKALGSGLMAQGAPGFTDILVRKTPQNAPYYMWTEKLETLIPSLEIPIFDQERSIVTYISGLRLASASLSLSHEGGLALAFAILSFDDSNALKVREEKAE